MDDRLTDDSKKIIVEKLTHHIRPEFEEDQFFWRDVGKDCLLVLPVEQLEGHGRLLISVLFQDASLEQRQDAERLYRERRPFAIGFFQLWQHNRVLSQRTRALELVLDHTAIGLVMLDRHGRVAFANQTASEILSIGDGLSRRNDVLRAATLGDGVNLQAALSQAIENDAEAGGEQPAKVSLVAFGRKNGPPLIAAFLPAASSSSEDDDIAAVMYLVDPQINTETMLTPLCRLYGLSPVETSLVCHLAAGETIGSSAERMHIKEPTARSYLKTVFIKTGTKRQTELVVLMLSSLIRMKRDVVQEAITATGGVRSLGSRA